MMIVIGIMEIIMVGTTSMMTYMMRGRQRANFLSSAEMIRTQLYGLIEDKDSWQKIIADNGNTYLNCLKTAAVDFCANNEVITGSAPNTYIKVVDQAGTDIYNPNTGGGKHGVK